VWGRWSSEALKIYAKKLKMLRKLIFRKDRKHRYNAAILGSPLKSEDEDGSIPESPHTDKRPEPQAGSSGSAQAVMMVMPWNFNIAAPEVFLINLQIQPRRHRSS
jgi:hypothetical protein